MLLIFQQYKVEQQVLYKSWRAPDPCVPVNNYIVQALQLDSFPYRVMEKSVAEGREILQASDSFFLFFFSPPCYLLMSEAQRCFSSSVGTLKFTQLSSWLPPTLKFPEPAEHCSLHNKTFHLTWWPTGYAQLRVPQHIHLQQKQSISNVATKSSLRKLLKKWCLILLYAMNWLHRSCSAVGERKGEWLCCDFFFYLFFWPPKV